jgi:hypothetical protein
MQQLVEIMRDLATQPNAVSVAFQRIDNFHKLVVDEVPYGTIDQNGLVQGLIEFDGPAQDPPNLKKPLQWHFGGIPYEVCKAIRIQYSYQKQVDNTYINASGSLFIGYGLGSPYSSALAAALQDAEKNEAADPAAQKRAAALRAADPANAPANQPATAADLLKALQADFVNSPGRVTALAKYVDAANFDQFLLDNFPFQQGQASGWQPSISSTQLPVGPTPLSTRLTDETDQGLPGVRIEYDGPARTYDSKRPFPYTTDTLFNEPSGMYDKLLWWYFGGRAFRITKAMRLEYTDVQGNKGSLLIGYQGPGPY